MGTINWSELFPEKWNAVIFVLYIALFINQGIIITWSQKKGNYDYNPVIVVLMSEVLKLVSCSILYCKENAFSTIFPKIFKHRRLLFLYMVPSALYCLYNNLQFVNLAAFDPTTYFLLLQLRVVITGIMFQVIFRKQLSLKQWISLILLTLGCMIKQVNLDYSINLPRANFHLNIHIVFIFIQVFCSCLAGVYNEYLLKGGSADVNIFLQNIFMYIDSILCNIAVLLIQGNLLETFNSAGPSIFMEPKVILIIFNNAAIGVVTSFFLKYLNSILKTFASSLELGFTAIFSWLLFGIPIYLNTILAIAIVIYAVILYSQNPVEIKSKSKNYDASDVEGNENLIESS